MRHWAGPGTIVQLPVDGSQHDPPPVHVNGPHTAPYTVVPAPRRHSAGSRLWHAPQQQHAGAGFLHVGNGPAAPHTELGPPYDPPIVRHVVGAACEQMFVVGSQHAPGTSVAHAVGLHDAPGPYHTPAFAMHSHGVTCWQCWKMQHVPKSCVPLAGHGLGWHETLG